MNFSISTTTTQGQHLTQHSYCMATCPPSWSHSYLTSFKIKESTHVLSAVSSVSSSVTATSESPLAWSPWRSGSCYLKVQSPVWQADNPSQVQRILGLLSSTHGPSRRNLVEPYACPPHTRGHRKWAMVSWPVEYHIFQFVFLVGLVLLLLSGYIIAWWV